MRYHHLAARSDPVCDGPAGPVHLRYANLFSRIHPDLPRMSSLPDSASNDRPRSDAKVTAIDILREPKSWTQIVGDHDRIELEIGSGKGLFLQNAAAKRPEHFFVGIELAGKFANRSAQRLAKHAPENTSMLRGDAKRFLQEVVPDRSVIAIHCYFPDPWWRNKHKKRRVLNEQTLNDIVRALLPLGEFHFWTDVLDYYEHICAEVMDSTPLLGPKYVPERPSQHSMDFTTHFERRARNDSQPVYRARFQKPDDA